MLSETTAAAANESGLSALRRKQEPSGGCGQAGGRPWNAEPPPEPRLWQHPPQHLGNHDVANDDVRRVSDGETERAAECRTDSGRDPGNDRPQQRHAREHTWASDRIERGRDERRQEANRNRHGKDNQQRDRR